MKKQEQENKVTSEDILAAALSNSDSGISTSDEAQAKAVSTLAETKDFRTMSDLDPDEVKLCTALDVISNKIDDNVMREVVDNFPLFRVSKLRLGRGEIKEIAAAKRDNELEKVSRLRRFFGLR